MTGGMRNSAHTLSGMTAAQAARLVELCDQGQEALRIAIVELTAMADECNASVSAREARLATLRAAEKPEARS